MAKENGVKGFWCNACHFGSTTTKAFTTCSQCGAVNSGVMKFPFPTKPLKVGSTNANGKTERKRRGGTPARGIPQKKITDKLEARKKADANHGKTHSQHTVPGSMKKGGGY